MKKDRRSSVGYGSTYRKGNETDCGRSDDIKTVLGGQAWMVKPDKHAKTANPCLWMKAGVVEFKNCNNFYDCTTCKYDKGMLKKSENGKQISWQDAMKRRPGMARVCRHSLTERISNRVCAYDYECSTCDFDQFFEDIWTTKNKSIPSEVQNIKGFDVPMGYYFHNGHAWARIESGGYVRVGLDDFALKVLGKADALDLPLMGKELHQGLAGWGLKRDNNAADVLSPVNGVIVEVNSAAREKPELANKEPYGDGWLFMVRTNDIKGTVKNLLTDTRSLEWINSEVNSLENMIEDVAGPMATDGGFIQEDVYGNLPGLSWNSLTNAFLKS